MKIPSILLWIEGTLPNFKTTKQAINQMKAIEVKELETSPLL